MKTSFVCVKTIFAWMCLCLAIFACPLATMAEADGAIPYFVDERNHLTPTQQAYITKRGAELSGETSLHVVIVAEGKGDDRYYMRQYGLSYQYDHVLLVLHSRSGEWYYDMHAYGTAEHDITESEMNRILDAPDVYDNLKNGVLFEGILAWQTLTAKAINARLTSKTAENLDVVSGDTAFFSESNEHFLSRVKIGVWLASFTSGVAVLIVVAKYRMKIKPTNYPLNKYATLVPTTREDIFLHTTITSRTVNNSSGGRSGGGGGRHGGR